MAVRVAARIGKGGKSVVVVVVVGIRVGRYEYDGYV